MNTPETVRSALEDLISSLWTLTALATALEAGIIEALTEPSTSSAVAARSGADVALVNAMLDSLRVAGLIHYEGAKYSLSTGLAALLQGPMRTAVVNNLRSNLLQGRDFYEWGRRKKLIRGWQQFADPDILESQGILSGMIADSLAGKLLAAMPGMSERFGRGAKFLDVGSGVGSISIEMCRRVPNLRCTGLEPAPVPMRIAKVKVADAGLADRIELRDQRVEHMEDSDCFDLAWLPTPFLEDAVLAKAIPRLLNSIHPGGWAVFFVPAAAGDDTHAVRNRLIRAIWGGDPLTPELLERRLSAEGFVQVSTQPNAFLGHPVVLACKPL
jgi:SAM-dependent methyltransferase